MEGWIKIHRGIIKHWVWSDPDKLRAWIDILLTVNHSSEKVLIGESLFICKRGQSLLSLESWAKRWRWNKSAVRRFFALLESDGMIERKSVKKTTQITVCNYDSYQEARNDSETIVKRKRNDSETKLTPNKNDKELIKNEKNENKIEGRKLKFASTLENFKDVYPAEMLNDFYRYWTEPNKSNSKFRQELERTWDLARRLDIWSKREISFKKEKSCGQKEKIDPVTAMQNSILKYYGNGIN